MNYQTKSCLIIGVAALVFSISCSPKRQATSAGKPWKGVVQHIPGKLQCEFYDEGGEGTAYHDQDSINNGSGKLNPADGTFLNEYRMNEGVDISYTKFRNPPIDNNPYNLVNPEKDQLYVGWTNPGEWINYTIEVREPGTYVVGLMYTANQDGEISLSVSPEDSTGTMKIPTTYIAEDSVDWRQWHHWNYLDSIGRITLKKGVQTIRLSTLKTGQMNYDYINFKLIN